MIPSKIEVKIQSLTNEAHFLSPAVSCPIRCPNRCVTVVQSPRFVSRMVERRRVFTIPILTRGIVTIWRSEYTRNRNSNFRFYSKMESFGTESLKNLTKSLKEVLITVTYGLFISQCMIYSFCLQMMPKICRFHLNLEKIDTLCLVDLL